MDSIDKLFLQINRNYNPDFWEEIERTDVANQLEKITNSEWDQLEDTLDRLSIQGKINLAEACGTAVHDRCVPMLIELLKSEEPLVGATVAIQLIEKNYIWNPDVSLMADLKRHRVHHMGYELKMIDRLIGRLVR